MLIYILLVNVAIIHRQAESFQELWNGLGDSIHKLRLVAVSHYSYFLDYIMNISNAYFSYFGFMRACAYYQVSLPDIGELTVPAMDSMYTTMKANLRCLNLWQVPFS